jgi:hypothetical protein
MLHETRLAPERHAADRGMKTVGTHHKIEPVRRGPIERHMDTVLVRVEPDDHVIETELRLVAGGFDKGPTEVRPRNLHFSVLASPGRHAGHPAAVPINDDEFANIGREIAQTRNETQALNNAEGIAPDVDRIAARPHALVALHDRHLVARRRQQAGERCAAYAAA